MAYKISDDCIACGACAAECPVEAISEGEDKYVIDEDLCVECGACASTCPVGAPSNDWSFTTHESTRGVPAGVFVWTFIFTNRKNMLYLT